MKAHAAVLLGCSWVLWQVTRDFTTLRPTYAVMQAEETKVACEDQKRAKMERFAAVFPRQGDGLIMSGTDGKARALLSFDCLPDTVDPRSH